MKERFFREARKESYLSDYHRARIGAVAVYCDKFILARAHNTEKTNPTQYHYNKFRAFEKKDIMTKPAKSHCEVNLYRAIRWLDIDFSKVVVYIYRETKDGVRALAAPCPGCKQALVHDLGIRTICYTGANSYIKEEF